MIKRALISVFDKNGILDFSKFLIENGVEIISTGGTYKHLRENGVTVTEINEVTNFPEMLDGRVKTLHPIIHAGILAIRNNEEHIKTIKEKNIETIDMVIVNLYPFFKKVREDLNFEEKVEFIDIGVLDCSAMIHVQKGVYTVNEKNDRIKILLQTGQVHVEEACRCMR